MLRTLTLSLLMLVSVGVMLPIASSTAHGIRQSVSAHQQHRKVRRHSRAWWRRYRARLRMRRAAALARRLRLQQGVSPYNAHRANPLPAATTIGGPNTPIANSAETKFRNGAAALPGQASLSVVAMSRPAPAYLTTREQQKQLSGVTHAELRRIVIDKMINYGGWVSNDYERDVAGHRVFVVTAHTPGDAKTPEKAWNFYFTEANGRIYSLTTNTSPQFADRMAIEAERLISSLYSKGDKTQK